MNNNIFDNSPFSSTMNSIYPSNKGIVLFYRDGILKEIYGREHAMMMQDIGYWYTDSWQNFLLNISYNGIMAMMIEFDTSLIYIPKIVTINQKKSFTDYIEKNVTRDKIELLNYYVMRCLSMNSYLGKFNGVEREKSGKLKHIDGEIINDERAYGYEEVCNCLDENVLDCNKLVKNMIIK